MSNRIQEPKKNKISYWNSIFSVTTVLFLTGFLGIFIYLAKKTSDVLKESVTIQVELVDTTAYAYNAFIHQVQSMPAVKKIKYISKDSAAAKLKKDLGEDFINVIGYNPLYNSLNVNIKSQYFDPKVIETIKSNILRDPIVRDAVYPKVISKSLEKNLRKVSLFIGGLVILLLIIAIVLIDSTIKLAMFSDRFLIKSMQFVGATRWFIMRPYLQRAILNGFISAIMACIALVLILNLIHRYIDLIDLEKEIYYISIIFLGLILLGVVITFMSTIFAVNKYLKLKLESLY